MGEPSVLHSSLVARAGAIAVALVFLTIGTRAHAQEPNSAHPGDAPPRLSNGSEVFKEVERAYPAELRNLKIEGRVLLRLFVNAKGASDTTRLHVTSAVSGMDRAAMRVARKMKFSPALRGGARVAGWVEIPVVFKLRSSPPSVNLSYPRLLNGDAVPRPLQRSTQILRPLVASLVSRSQSMLPVMFGKSE